MEEHDIIVINSSNFISKKNNKEYNTIDFILADKESYIDSDHFKGYSISHSFVNVKVLNDIDIMKPVKGVFDEWRKGLSKELKLKAIKLSNGKVINLV